MTYKQQICNRIIEKMEWWREAQWADHIDLHTKDAVITVMENVVDGIANMRQSRYEKNADRWIPCSERMSGAWETIEGWDGDEIYRCSACGEEFVLIDGTPKDNGYHFCPNCGADMRGTE